MSVEDLYWIKKWGEGYFEVNTAGHISVRPHIQGNSGDLFVLIQSLVKQGIEAPILIRFNGIIRDRMQRLHGAFNNAIHEFKYRNVHKMVYPVKVNPQRHVVDTVLQAGHQHHIGLEVGSKPELIAMLAIGSSPESLLLCNGYKDAEYISLALMATKLGRRTIIIIEQMYELNIVLDMATRLEIEAEIGFRMKLSNYGSGRWRASGGEHSKFGLFSHEIISCIEQLQTQRKTEWVKLLHFHLGSQVTSIESIKKALKEGACMYTELAKLLPSLDFFDVGGGLAVDYDGSKSTADSSMNYAVEEYARDVVFVIGNACLSAGIADPIIITESGRALVSHHSVLITEIIDVAPLSDHSEKWNAPSQHNILRSLQEHEEALSLENCRESLHEVIKLKEHAFQEFIYGKLSLIERAYVEKKSHYLFTKIRTLSKQLSKIPEEFVMLDNILQETYFCNFSVFQSLPDSWAINQLFPVMPIHRLHGIPTHQAILADLTCDSDGKISSFIEGHAIAPFIKLHEYTNIPYYIGIFMVGAYQEILGGLHNLFGDTNVVHAELGQDGLWELSHLVEGDTVEEVLHYVQYDPKQLISQLQGLIEHALKAKRISLSESAQIKRKFKQALESYTYLVI